MGAGAAMNAGQVARLGDLPDDDERGLAEIHRGHALGSGRKFRPGQSRILVTVRM